MTDISILQAIETEHGKVTAALVVEAARDPEHPWHDRIDWNDDTAAERWRLTQARALIRSVRYERRTETRIIAAPAYVRDPDAMPHEQSYVSVATLRNDQDRARTALIGEFSRVASALRRAREIADALNLADEVRAMLTQIEGLRVALQQPSHAAPEARQ
jgi:hypothetical protein